MKYGLIAGNGRFPFLVLEGARDRGAETIIAAIKEEDDPDQIHPPSLRNAPKRQ